MRLDMPRRSRRRLSMTSLIDVIFLLLLFFMLSSTFTRFASVELAAPASAGGSGRQTADIIVKPGDEEWRINGVSVSQAEIAPTLEGYREKGAARALLIVDPAVASQGFVKALETLRYLQFTVTVAK
jgi:biopolymer transport protein ExbD